MAPPPGIEAPVNAWTLMRARALRVVPPTPGRWKLRLLAVAGRGVFFVTAEAASELSLDEARFVQPGGRPGHEGLYPVKRPPMLGSQGSAGIGTGERAGAERPRAACRLLVRIPVLRHPAFRIAVEGVDERGWPFQRMHVPLTAVANQ